jgi:hypothetical protein
MITGRLWLMLLYAGNRRVQKLVDRLSEASDDLLSFLGLFTLTLEHWQQRLIALFTDPFFQTTVARTWPLDHALRNGHRTFTHVASLSRQLLSEFIADYPTAHHLAQDLLARLESVVRTSCATEAVNSVLRPFMDSRLECTDQTSRQLFLNLFKLWFNMHPFERGPRAGKSPTNWRALILVRTTGLGFSAIPPIYCSLFLLHHFSSPAFPAFLLVFAIQFV